jgi:hypothetical protein
MKMSQCFFFISFSNGTGREKYLKTLPVPKKKKAGKYFEQYVFHAGTSLKHIQTIVTSLNIKYTVGPN